MKSSKRKTRPGAFPETGTKQAFKQAVLGALPDRRKNVITVLTTFIDGKQSEQTYTFLDDNDDIFVYPLNTQHYHVTFDLGTPT